MAELHSNIYYKHPKPEIMQKLDSLFSDCEGDENSLIRIATQINQAEGAKFARDLLSKVEEPEYDIDAESLEKVDGYTVAHLVHGSAGDEIVKNIIKFLYALIPDIHAQAWGCGDDDPWEFWLKYENNRLIRKDVEPFIDEDEDQEILNTVYIWWHETMPSAISEGLLNEDREIDLEDEHVVFTGKMECGTREEMEKLAIELGANVQKSITKKTTLLGVGERPGDSKLAKARDLNIRIITEAEYNDIIDSDYDAKEEKEYPLLSDVPGFESLRDLRLEKASELLRQIGKNGFAGIPFSRFKEISESGISARQRFDRNGIDIDPGRVGGGFCYEDDLDINFRDVASVAVNLGLTTEDEIRSLINKRIHTSPEGVKWKGETDEFRCELAVLLSPYTSNHVMYIFDYSRNG